MKNNFILFLCPYPKGSAPSQRFRFEQYLDSLKNQNTKIAFEPFLSDRSWANLYSNATSFIKVTGVIKGFLKRFFLLFTLYKYDYIFIHREATPVGPPWFEYISSRILKKKIIYDFDDAIWLEDPDEKNTFLAKLKWKSKVSRICKWSYKISTGNMYLADFAKKYNTNVQVLPTTIDTQDHHNPHLLNKVKYKKFVIGWTGTHSTLQYLDPILPIIQELEKVCDFTFLVIANRNPEYNLKSFKFLPWRQETEIEDLLKIDIGIMPLKKDEWSKGKCGFKLLQYMALEIPSIASDVGVNNSIIKHGKNGLFFKNDVELRQNLKTLIKDENLRESLGKNGRQTVEAEYSVEANREAFLSLFK